MSDELRLLVVDDDAVDRKTIRRALDKIDRTSEVVVASDSREAFDIVASQPAFDCILLDYNLPGMDGLQLLSELRSRLGTTVPIVMLTGEGSEVVAVDAMKRGACDYLPKSLLAPDTLYRAIGRAVDDAQLRRQLAEAQAQLEHQALYDALSGLGNRRLFMRDLARSIADGQRHDRPFCLLMMDLDKFKAANDTFGHAAGDAVIAEVGRRLAGCGRANDAFYRVGGDEFVGLVDAADDGHVEPLVRRIHEKLLAAIDYQGHAVEIGVSIGIAFYPADGTTADALMQAADAAMYRAKRAGRQADPSASGPA